MTMLLGPVKKKEAPAKDSAEGGAYASVLFDEINATLQIIAAKKDVVEHRRHLVNERRNFRLWPLMAEKDGWSDERRTGYGQERSTWYRSHER